MTTVSVSIHKDGVHLHPDLEFRTLPCPLLTAITPTDLDALDIFYGCKNDHLGICGNPDQVGCFSKQVCNLKSRAALGRVEVWRRNRWRNSTSIWTPRMAAPGIHQRRVSRRPLLSAVQKHRPNVPGASSLSFVYLLIVIVDVIVSLIVLIVSLIVLFVNSIILIANSIIQIVIL